MLRKLRVHGFTLGRQAEPDVGCSGVYDTQRKLQIIDKAANIARQPRSEYLVENAVARAMDLLGKAPARKGTKRAGKKR